MALVTLNRVNDPRFPKDVCGVVKQKDNINGYTVCQFSWFCEKIARAIRSEKNYEESVQVARKALTEPIAHVRISQMNAMFYHASYVHPKWDKKGVVMKIGNHIFYTRT